MTRIGLAVFAFSFLALLGLLGMHQEPRWPMDPGVPDGITATFSIAAVDPATGQSGAAVASKYPAVGKVVAHARPGVGAFCTQHYDMRVWGPKALDLLADGKLPEETLAELLRPDKKPGLRQLGIIDMNGRSDQRHPVE